MRIFALTLWSWSKNGLIRNIKLFSKFVTSITIRILPNISRSKGNQTMKFGHLIECNKIIFFLKKHAENEAERLVPDIAFFKKKVL